MDGVKLTKLWIERFVIGLRLCPFAHYSFYGNTIYYKESTSFELKDCVYDLMSVVQKMNAISPSELSNAFLIFNSSLSFHEILNLKEQFDDKLLENNLADEFQVVVFHPEFQFGDEDFHAAGNFVNRSPLPMIHLLREEEVAKAIESTDDVDQIPLRNKDVLEKIKIRNISEVFEDEFVEKIKPYI